jgi:RNA polymerase sigma-70 factor (ECF subfamily)
MLIDRLPEAQREALILRYYADLSFKEIAQIVNVGINTALGRVRYAVMNMRKMMERETSPEVV